MSYFHHFASTHIEKVPEHSLAVMRTTNIDLFVEATAAGSSPDSGHQLTLRQTSELSTDLVQGSDPFEHISPNTSLAYWQERTAILHRFHRIKSTSMSTRK
jgi:hypothetical protein